MSVVKYSALSSPVTILNSDGTAPSLKNLASITDIVSNEISNDQSGERNQFAVFELKVTFGSAPSGAFDMYILKKGSDYEYGAVGVRPAPSAYVDSFLPRAASGTQRIIIDGIRLPPGDFKVYLLNSTSLATSNVDGENGLQMWTYNNEIV